MDVENIDVEKTIANIEQYGEANPKELAGEAVQAEEKPFLSFKNNDDFLKYELEYKADQKTVKEDLATILQRAQKGYHYAQNMQKFNQDRESFENERKTISQQMAEAKALQEKWSKFENYAKEKPEWYEHWENAWNNRESQGREFSGEHTDFESKLNNALAERLKPYDELLNKSKDIELQAKISEDDRVLDDQVKSIRKTYANIDFDRTDPATGKSLEFQVLEFMSQNGMNNFNHAFKAFYHDNLVKLEIERQKETEQKSIMEKKKMGIIGEKPLNGISKRVSDTKGLSWDQIAAMAGKDLGIE